MWNPFSYDSFDVEGLPSIDTDRDFDEGIVTADDKADDDLDLDLFKSYQLTKEECDMEDDDDSCTEDNMSIDDDDVEEESATPFAEMDDIFNEADDGEKTTHNGINKSAAKAADKEQSSDKTNDAPAVKEESIFTELEATVEDIEECDDGEDFVQADDSEEECTSPFKEMDDVMAGDEDEDQEDDTSDIAEAVLDDEEDDLIASELEDMPEDDDPEIEADVDGVNEIEEDIIDDEEDDLIDMAMDADTDEDVDYED